MKDDTRSESQSSNDIDRLCPLSPNTGHQIDFHEAAKIKFKLNPKYSWILATNLEQDVPQEFLFLECPRNEFTDE